ncbi:hypothetical protein L596_000349 [Steinernema carpocapsae]|uniref:Uncharacterized protein n=1 Tax=Steinernema carpocapsae TaxID=34508 RepID=A0A4U8UIP9_STECR|nr:hypothetical protein L596_000349 [Steinernema carpocapsae]
MAPMPTSLPSNHPEKISFIVILLVVYLCGSALCIVRYIMSEFLCPPVDDDILVYSDPDPEEEEDPAIALPLPKASALM